MLTLRPYQDHAVENLRGGLRRKIRRQMLYSPTGSGKTEMAMAVIRGAVAKKKRVIFLCNRIQLVQQASSRFAKAGIEHGVIQGDNSRAAYLPMIVASIQTISSRRFSLSEFDLIVVDEAHGCGGSTQYHEVFFANKDKPIIGLTATPWTAGLGREYAQLEGPLFQEMVVAATIPELIESGYLVDADIYGPSEPDLSKVEVTGDDYNEKQLEDAVNRPKLIGDIVEHWLERGNGMSTVCFATSIAHSKAIVEQFQRFDVAAEHMDYLTSDVDRAAILGRVTAGETKVVSNVGILTEGWDCPVVRVMILARPTKSLTRYIQMAGRVLRPYIDPVTGETKEKALILDHSGTCRRLGFPTDEHPLILDTTKPGKKKPYAPPEEKLPKVCSHCSFLKAAGVWKCPACGFAPQRQSEVSAVDGTLVLMKRSKKTKDEKAHAERFGSKQDVFSMLMHERNQRQYSKGWVSNKYRKIFDVWPTGLQHSPKKPSDEFQRWLKAEQIRFIKGLKKKEQANAAA